MYKQGWWEQVLKSAGEDFIPILIYKFDRKPIYCVVPAYLISRAPKNNQVVYMCPLEELCKKMGQILEVKNDG